MKLKKSIIKHVSKLFLSFYYFIVFLFKKIIARFMMFKKNGILYISIFMFLISLLCGILILNYKIFNCNNKVVDYKSFYSEIINGWVYLKLESEDTFVAGRSIDVTIHVRSAHDIDYLQFTFIGASKYFPTDFKNSLNEDSFNEVIQLEKIDSGHNLESGPSSFKGFIKDLNYGTGGNFGIGITGTNNNGIIVGYGMGDNKFVVNDIISIAPREVLVGIKTNQSLIIFAVLSIVISLFIFMLTMMTKKKKAYPVK